MVQENIDEPISGAKRKKVLILSLGTGRIVAADNGDDRGLALQDAIRRGEYRYQNTVYRLRGSEYSGEGGGGVPFVAFPLLRDYQPDLVWIIGTVKSCWTSFYTYFSGYGKESKQFLDDVTELDDIEFRGNISTSSSDLDTAQGRINAIYGRGLKKDLFPEVSVLLVRYGVDDGELGDNYRRLKDFIKSRLSGEGGHYSAAFDITHSFRSMPLYNLILLDYIRSVEKTEIGIDHVYYGMLEAKRDLGYEPVVDLEELIRVLELSKGVSEFLATGNSITLQKQIPDGSELRKLLGDFDTALQLNEISKIFSSLHTLLNYLKTAKPVGKYDSLHAMLERVLREDFLGREVAAWIETDEELREIEKFTQLQRVLVRWFLRTRRYGLACTTEQEVMKTFLVPLILKNENVDISLDNVLEQRYRDKVITQWHSRAANYVLWGKDFEFVTKFETQREKVKKIRNQFAHNLDERRKNLKDKLMPDTAEILEIIKDFSDLLEELKERIKDEEFCEKYCRKKLPRTNHNLEMQGVETTLPVVIVLSPDHFASDDYIFLKNSNKKKYAVFSLPADVLKRIKNNQSDLRTLAALSYYIKRNVSSVSHVRVIFDGFEPCGEVLLMTFMTMNATGATITFERLIRDFAPHNSIIVKAKTIKTSILRFEQIFSFVPDVQFDPESIFDDRTEEIADEFCHNKLVEL